MTLTELCRAIAENGDEWQKPGVRVVDMETGWGFRWLKAGHLAEDCATPCALIAVDPVFQINAKARAIAAGPDWQDDATLGVMLGSDGCVWQTMILGKEAWMASVKNDFIRPSPTRAEAILRAYAASRGIA